jgi:hypothetical protein
MIKLLKYKFIIKFYYDLKNYFKNDFDINLISKCEISKSLTETKKTDKIQINRRNILDKLKDYYSRL